MRAVLFLFYSLEILLNMVLVSVNLEGIIKQLIDSTPLATKIRHGFYTFSFYSCGTVTMWASINISLGYPYYFSEEIIRSIVGFVLYLTISLLTLNDAEADFGLIYINKDEDEILHPFFQYLRLQAVLSMAIGVVYLLHCVIVVDVMLAGIAEHNSPAEKKKRRKDELELDFRPVKVYLLGRQFEMYLEQFKWYNEFKNKGA